MQRLTDVTTRVAHAFRFVRAGDKNLAWRDLTPDLAATLSITSPEFEAGHPLPQSAHRSPPVLQIRNVPAAAKALVLLCEGPDAPLPKPFVHWMLYRLPGRDMTIDGHAIAAACEGKNSFFKTGYAPVDPPRGHGVHHYHFQVFALEQKLAGAVDEPLMAMPTYQDPLGVQSGIGRRELIEQMRGRVIAWGEIVGTCEA